MNTTSSPQNGIVRLLMGLCALLLVFFARVEAGEVLVFNEEFDGPDLDSSWFVWDGYAFNYPDDIGNHAAFAMTGSQLSISAPGGAEHNMWWLEHAQVTRAFEGSGVYEIKVDSTFDGSQQFGFVFESGPGTFMVLMLYANERVWGYVERFVNVDGLQYKTTFPGCCAFGHDTGLVVPAPGPYWLRVVLKDDLEPEERHWMFEWSTDGVEWTTVVDGVLEEAGVTGNIGAIQSVGVFAGNHPYFYSAFDARFDYYRTYPLDAVPTGGPGNLVAIPGDQHVALSWDALEGADEYWVYRSNTPGGPYTFLANTTSPSYLDSGLVNGLVYAYVVTAQVDGIETSESDEVKAIPHVAQDFGFLPESGRLMVLNADTLNYTHFGGEKVTQWVDASGGPFMASVIERNAPTFVLDGIAGHGAVRFDGVDDYLSLPAGFADFTEGLTLFVVARPTVVQGGAKLLLLGNGAGAENVGFGRNGGGAGLQYFTTNGGGSYGWFGTDAALADGEAAVYGVVQGGGVADATVTATVSKNGQAVGGGPVYVPPVATRASNYLGRSYWGSDGYFQGDIAEVILYDRALSPDEQALVHAYLAEKYELDVEAPPTLVLDPPSAAVAVAGDGEVALSWGAVAGATGYRVYRRVGATDVYGEIHAGSDTSYTDTAVTNGTTYRYVVTAYDASQESAYSAEAVATPTAPPPALVPPPELPADDLVLLLDAGTAALERVDGSEVTTWRDVSGRGHDAFTAAGRAPTLVAGVLGGDAVLRFDGVDDYLSLPAGFADFTEGLTLFVVARPTVVQGGAKLLLLGNGAGAENVGFGRNGGGAGLQYFTTNGGGSYGWFGTDAALADGEAAVYGVVQGGGVADATVTATVSKNGQAVGGGPVYVPPVATRASNYLGRSYWGSDGYFQGDIAEVILYDRALSPDEQALVHAYLAEKYELDVE
ncbi:LamG-like jellyroll fold domain-containing protein [Thiococcus pfennigii]|uniref:LamG-like jellyroll fold domain-containing protein n=3 Tax=Thiococcus pfennigii TaxID=1057 RepID=UPI0019061317|nr:LamG-like jellyroll fold domain-containing protein [Thiococcus pfennigii]